MTTDRTEQDSKFSRLYIANQGMTEYMDEIRWLALAMRRRKNIALQGEPGNGKSSAIRFVADILGKEVYARTCHVHEQDYDYQGRPVLIDGKTSYADTELKRALRNGGLFLNEESSEMPKHSQKSLSMLLTGDYDDYTILDDIGNKVTLREMKDRTGWKVDDFVYAETFNPSGKTSGRDNFEFSHKSRSSPFIFNDVDSLLGAYIALNLIDKKIDLPLEERGIIYDPKSDHLVFTQVDSNGNWVNIANQEKIQEVGQMSRYLYFNRSEFKRDSNNVDRVKEQIKGHGDFYFNYLKFLTTLRGVVSVENISNDSLYQEVQSELSSHSHDGNGISLVYPDQRTIELGFKSYNDALVLFGDVEHASHSTTYEMIDHILHGALADKSVNGGVRQWNHIKAIAAACNLVPTPRDATNMG